jgi:dihydroxy-acid dehydratase
VPAQLSVGQDVVCPYEGPNGGPGMHVMLALTSALIAAGWDDKVGLMMDGRFSCATYGLVAGHIASETALGVF